MFGLNYLEKDNIIVQGKMGKGKRESSYTFVLKPFALCFYVSRASDKRVKAKEAKLAEAAAAADPEAAIVAAGKHFSSKVRLI